MHGGSRRLVDAQWWTVARDIFAYPPEAPQAPGGGEQAEREVKAQVFAACQASAEPEELTGCSASANGPLGLPHLLPYAFQNLLSRGLQWQVGKSSTYAPARERSGVRFHDGYLS